MSSERVAPVSPQRKERIDGFANSSTTAAVPASRNADLLAIRVASLENEIMDTKRLLLDAICDRKDAEKQKAELVSVISELTGGSINGEVAEEMITDRAKRTMMMLRMERTETMKRKLQAVVRQRSLELQAKVKHLKHSIKDFKSDVEQQLSRLGSVLTLGLTNFILLKDKLAREARLHAATNLSGGFGASVGLHASQNSGSGVGDDYLDMVTAAVKEQQKSIVLPPDHPIIVQLKQLFDHNDKLSEVLNASWAAMRCFRDGRPPNLHKLRRFVDPLVNISNYTARAKTMVGFVEHADMMGILFNEMHLPQLERSTRRIITTVDSKLRHKLDAAFEAMKVIRSPAQFHNHSVSNAIRLFSAADGVPAKAVADVNTRYVELAKGHTAKCFRYLRNMLKSTVSYSRSAHRNQQLSDDDLLDLMPDPNDSQASYQHSMPGSPISVQEPQGMSGSTTGGTQGLSGQVGNACSGLSSSGIAVKGANRPGVFRPRCGNCEIPMICEDCVSIQTKRPDQQTFLEFRRKKILYFTEDRVLHLHSLIALVDDFLLHLRKARIISVESFQEATRARSVSATSKIYSQNFGIYDNRPGSPGRAGSPPSGRRRRPEGLSGGTPRSPTQHAPKVTHGAEQAALQLIHTHAIRTSTYYFEQLRKKKTIMEDIHNPLLPLVAKPKVPRTPGSNTTGRRRNKATELEYSSPRAGTAPASLASLSGELAVQPPQRQPNAIPWSEPPQTPAAQQKFVTDLEFLERLHRRQADLHAIDASHQRERRNSGSLGSREGGQEISAPRGFRSTNPSTPRRVVGSNMKGGSAAGPPTTQTLPTPGRLHASPRGAPPQDPTTQQTRIGPLMDPALIQSLGKAMELDA